MKTISHILFVCCMALVFAGCSEQQPVGFQPEDSVPPGAVTGLNATNIPGGADIEYTEPGDGDLLFVKAAYTDTQGIHREVVSSPGGTTMRIEGLGSTDPVEVTFTAADRSKNVSAPAKITITPLTPPILDVIDSVKGFANFGGPAFTWDNPTGLKIELTYFTKDEDGRYITVSSESTSNSSAETGTTLYGFPEEPRDFAVQVKDKFGNTSEMLPFNITPLFEMELPKDKFRKYSLAGEPPHHSTYQMENMWDGNYATNAPPFETQASPEPQFPIRFTFDLGAKYRLSRYVHYPRHLSNTETLQRIYHHANLKDWEVWGYMGSSTDMINGSDEAPDQSQSYTNMEGWVLLAVHSNFRPSGLPATTMPTQADLDYMIGPGGITNPSGENHTVPLDAPPVRYLRFNCTAAWYRPSASGAGMIYVAEMTFFGSPHGN